MIGIDTGFFVELIRREYCVTKLCLIELRLPLKKVANCSKYLIEYLFNDPIKKITGTYD